MPVNLATDESASKQAVERASHSTAKGEPSAAKPIYTCPMHPEVEQDHPGQCPKCGMTLEPKTVTAGTDEDESAELRDIAARFWIGAGLALPVFVLALAHLIPMLGRQSWAVGRVSRGCQSALADVLGGVPGKEPALFRPPFGGRRPDVLAASRLAGCEPILWSVSARDWVLPTASAIEQEVASHIRGGDVIRHNIPQEFKPEHGDLSKNAALIRNACRQNVVEGGNAIRCDEEQVVGVDGIHVADFAAGVELEIRKVCANQDGVEKLFRHGLILREDEQRF